MGGDHHRPAARPSHVSSLSFLFISLYLLTLNNANLVVAKDGDAAYRPPDNYLIDCGSSSETKLDDGLTFKSDSEASSLPVDE
ncbi:hypothetical protein DITRI_Ditri08aG0114400 [Diplodiscus trichospermus]